MRNLQKDWKLAEELQNRHTIDLDDYARELLDDHCKENGEEWLVRAIQAEALLAKYEEWEAEWLMNPSAWQDLDPVVPQDVFDKYLGLQTDRNEVLGRHWKCGCVDGAAYVRKGVGWGCEGCGKYRHLGDPGFEDVEKHYREAIK